MKNQRIELDPSIELESSSIDPANRASNLPIELESSSIGSFPALPGNIQDSKHPVIEVKEVGGRGGSL